jgi:muramidase (phage lysozyme)
LQKFLDMLAWSEGTSTSPVTLANGYDVIVSGVDGPHTFTDYSEHPFANGRPAIEVVAPGELFPMGLRSTASGRYQIILPTWRSLEVALALTDFSPQSQDAAALELIRQRGQIETILSGNIHAAIMGCSAIWASLPGSTARQGGKTMGELLAQYDS